MKKFSFVLVFTMLMVSNAFAAQKARVMFVRGNVSALLPRAMKPIKVKKGDIYPEDTSILTKKKSIVRLKFADASTVNLGPNSKIVVTKMPKKEANIVNVLTGAIKAEVNKKSPKKTKTKMVLRTQSAVMGVRGTKFQASYNPANKVTSLVTVEGEVVMAKATPKTIKTTSVKVIDKSLNNVKKRVVVKPGKYASTIKSISKPTKPVNIAPQQFNALAKSMNSTKVATVVMNDNVDDKDPNRKIDVKNNVVQYKAGGYVDFESGLYVEPKKNSKLDKRTNTYVAKGIGKADRQGNYKTPEKLKKKKSPEKKEEGSSFWKKILPLSYTVGFNYRPFSEKLDNDNDGRESSFLSESADYAFVTFGFQWTENLYMSFNKGGANYDVNEEDVPVEDHGGGGNYFAIKFQYKLNDIWKLYFGLEEQTYYFSYENLDSSNPRIQSDEREIFAWVIGATKKLDFWNKHNLESNFYLKLFEEEEIYVGGNTPDTPTVKSIGFYGDIVANYKFWTKYNFKPGLWAEFTSHSAEKYDATRLRLGLNLLVEVTF